MSSWHTRMNVLPKGVEPWIDYDEDEDVVAIFVDDLEDDNRRVLKCLDRPGMPGHSQLVVLEKPHHEEWDMVYVGKRAELERVMLDLLASGEWHLTWVTEDEDWWRKAGNHEGIELEDFRDEVVEMDRDG